MRYRTMAALMRPFQERQASRARRGMRSFLSDYGAAIAGKEAASIRPVSGTFIYHRPPDYRGAPAAAWGKEEWLREFGRLKSLGIDTVLYQGAVGAVARAEWPWLVLIALCTIGYRWFQLAAVRTGPVALVLAVKRMSILYATLLAGRLFSEERRGRRLLGAALIVAAGFLFLGSE